MIDFTAFFKVSYGMYIVSAGMEDNANGFISNSVFQVTAEPAKFAACCNKENYTAQMIQNYGSFGISVLNENTPKELIGTFGYKSGRDINKMSSVTTKISITGVPIVTDSCSAYFNCKLVDTFDVGTHYIFIGEVTESALLTEDVPLTYNYYREVKKGKAPKNAPTFIDNSKLTAPPKSATKKYRCVICGHVYDPDIGDPLNGIAAGTAFEDLPPGWSCPVCGASKDDFEEI